MLNVCGLVVQLCLTFCDHRDCSLPGPSVHGVIQARILEWVGHSLLQRIFPTQGSNPGLLYYRQILYRLSHQEIEVVKAVLLVLHQISEGKFSVSHH